MAVFDLKSTTTLHQIQCITTIVHSSTMVSYFVTSSPILLAPKVLRTSDIQLSSSFVHRKTTRSKSFLKKRVYLKKTTYCNKCPILSEWRTAVQYVYKFSICHSDIYTQLERKMEKKNEN